MRGIMAADAKIDLCFRRRDSREITEMLLVAPIGKNAKDRRSAWASLDFTTELLSEAMPSAVAILLLNAAENLLPTV